MKKTVRIMDIELDILDDQELEKAVREYLTDDYLNVVLLASQKLLLWAAENDKFREMLQRAELILPGEEELLSLHHGEILKAGGTVMNYHCLENLLVALRKEQKTVYVVLENQEHFSLIEHFFRWCQSEMTLIGSAIEPEMANESIVNEINSLAPDILLVDLETIKQENWIMEHSTQLNSKLCIGLGGIIEQMIAEYKEEPKLVSRLHLSGVYNMLFRKNRYGKIKREKTFRQKMGEYTKKKRGSKQ